MIFENISTLSGIAYQNEAVLYHFEASVSVDNWKRMDFRVNMLLS
jgi:hypothetical protein